MWFTYHPEDGGSKHLWNVSQFLPDHTVQYPSRQSSSYSPLWETETSTWSKKYAQHYLFL
jgi:hypothetical protein